MSESKKTGFMIERGFHYVVMLFVSMLIIASIAMAFIAARGQGERSEMQEEISEDGGKTKPLPDFIVDKVPSDELEMLKP